MQLAWREIGQSDLDLFFLEPLRVLNAHQFQPCCCICEGSRPQSSTPSSPNLQGTGYAALQRIDCRVENGVVELLGEVPSFYCKQVAQAVVVALSHIRRVENRLRV